MRQTKDAKQLAGSTKAAPGGQTLPTDTNNGAEPADMLLALLNNALQSMLVANQAKILGHVDTRGHRVGTVVIFFDVKPDENGKLA